MMPVMKMRAGATSAESTPPAPKSDQKIGSWERFMSHPAHDDVEEERGGHRGRTSASGYEHLGERTATDAKVRGGFRRDLPPRVGVIPNRQQREPVEQDRPW